jgi:methylmalonyl-CoA mutase
MSLEAPFPLSPFPPADLDAWRQQVAKDLKGAPLDKLNLPTQEGFSVPPLRTPSDVAPDAAGLPGFPPFTRGDAPLGLALTGWDTSLACDIPHPTEANRAILDDLEGGASAVLLEVDPTGRAPRGVAVRDLDDLRAVLEGVRLTDIALDLDAGPGALGVAAALLALWREQGLDASLGLRGSLGLDPLGSLAKVGALPLPVDESIVLGVALADWCAARAPQVRAFAVDTAAYHHAGAPESVDLACAVATGLTYLKMMEGVGLPLDAAFSQLAFRVRLDGRLFMDLAKLRALRQLWGRVATACGVEHPKLHVTARLSARAITARDPWTNLLRNTVACFSSAVGGAHAFVSEPFDAALHLSTPQGRRAARNASLLLREEAHLHRWIDPAGGSYSLEDLTAKLADAAWARFQDIERAGGMRAALPLVRGWIDAAWEASAQDLAKRKRPITGVSAWPNLRESPPPVPSYASPPPKPFVPISATTQARQALREQAGVLDHLLAPLVDAVADGASLAALWEPLADLGPPASAPPFPLRRKAAAFEALRDRSDAALQRTGHRPTVFLANLGALADHSARATFALHFVEAGGLEATPSDGFDRADAAAEAFVASGARIAAICGTDAQYAQHAAAFAAALRGAGARRVIVAGRPGALEQALKDAGVTDFIYLGCDVVAALEALWRDAEV